MGRRAIALAMIVTLTGCEAFSSDPGARSIGTLVDDQGIELLVRRSLDEASPELEDSNIGITSVNGVVLLTGQVASVDLKQKAESTLQEIRKIRRIHNELEVAGATSALARTNDSYLTTKVKAQLVADESVNADRIKVVTENGVVYLMGSLSREDADAAVAVARNVGGVQRIVTLFDYL